VVNIANTSLPESTTHKQIRAMHDKYAGRSFFCGRILALVALCNLGIAFVIAHEGHALLPTRGVQVDAAKGYLLLTADTRARLDVETAIVEPCAVEERVLAIASLVSPWQNHGFATTKLAGRIVRVHITAGQTVRGGDPIAEVESLELDSLQQDLLSIRNDIQLAEKLVAELKKAAETGIAAGQSVVDMETKLAQDRNAQDVARAKWIGLGLPRDLLDDLLSRGVQIPGLKLTVRAPVSGTIIHTDLTAGRVVEPSDHLVEVVDLSSVWVKIGVLESDLHRVHIGQRVELQLAAYPGDSFQTTVRATSPYLDPATHIFNIWGELRNEPGGEPRFQPGMAGRAYLVMTEDAARPTIPIDSLIREGAERFVLVEEANSVGSSEYRKKAVVLKLSPEAERTIGLKIETVSTLAVDEIIKLDGAIEIPPEQRGFAASQLAGTIRTIAGERGQQVKPGDVLAEVYSPELLSMQQELLRLHQEASLTTDTLSRLRNSPGVAIRRLWELESRQKGLEGQSETLRRKLLIVGLEQEQIARLVTDKELITSVPIRAPIAGTVVNFDKALGQAISPREPLFEIHDLSHPLVQGFVSERDSGRVRPGLPVRIRLVADPRTVFTGKVVRSGRNIGLDTRSKIVWIELDASPRDAIFHKQLAAVSAVLASRPPQVAVPLSAVASEGTSSFVFVRRSDGIFDRRTVETGPADDRFITITRGLTMGETVVVAGTSELMTAYASLR
jgi:membrane fusion protein, heavy metal efflux system